MSEKTRSTADKASPRQRKPYRAPVLQRYGDLRDVSKGNLAYAAEEGRIYTDFAAS